MIKKISMFLIVMLASVVMITSNVILEAASDQTKKSTFTSKIDVEEDVYGMSHIVDKGTATTSGADHLQNINVFQMKTDGVSSKLVAWAVQSGNTTYSRTSITAAAKDYERTHPGWIVLGGINADQYFTKLGTSVSDGSAIMYPSPYYPMILDGENRFSVTATTNSTNVVGFTNNGTDNRFVGSNGIGGYALTIIDEDGNDVSTFSVSGVNKVAGQNDTTLWHSTLSPNFTNKYADLAVSTQNNLYVVEKADLSYLSIHSSYNYTFGGGSPDTFFCKGEISNSSLKEVTLKGGQFAVETTNPDLINALSNGVKIRVEHLFNNAELNNVESAIGFHSVQRQNGQDNLDTAFSENPYNKKQYPRALVGRRADGTYVLITADSVALMKSFGLNFTEINAVAAHYNVVDLYQMDGGGSVTAMTRQADGTFKVTNVPSDTGNPNSPRSNYSYLFFVKRDPGLTQNQDLTTYHSITLDKVDTPKASEIQNIKVKLNDKTYDFEGNSLTIDNLDPNTSYTANITYDIVSGGKTLTDTVNLTYQTKSFNFPTDPFGIDNITDSSITIYKKPTESASNIKNVTVCIDKDEYYLGDNDTITCDNLLKGKSYILSFKYDYYDEVTGKLYQTTTLPSLFDTLKYATPVIISISESVKTSTILGIKYEYKDEDSRVENAYILCNDEQYPVENKNGTISLSGLDFANNTYNIKLVLEYKNDAGRIVILESEVLTYEASNNTPAPNPSPSGGCSMGSVKLFISLISLASLLSIVLRKRN